MKEIHALFIKMCVCTGNNVVRPWVSQNHNTDINIRAQIRQLAQQIAAACIDASMTERDLRCMWKCALFPFASKPLTEVMQNALIKSKLFQVQIWRICTVYTHSVSVQLPLFTMQSSNNSSTYFTIWMAGSLNAAHYSHTNQMHGTTHHLNFEKENPEPIV